MSETDLFISVGGAMFVGDKKEYPFLKQEARLIEQCLKEKKKYLGICLGAELLADVMGAKVHRGASHEKGWQEIQFIDSSLKMFTNHQDKFDLPAGAKRFASGHHNLNQGFVFENRAYALQFHPNSERETIVKIAESPSRKTGPAIQSKEEIHQGLVHLEEMHQWLRSFCLRLSEA